jgi:DNA polymerase I
VAFTFEFLDDGVRRWDATPDGAEATLDTAYSPTLYATADTRASLADLRDALLAHPGVVDTGVVEKRRGWRHDPEPVLQVDVAGMETVAPVARTVRSRGGIDAFRCYDVDLSPGFRYCLDTGTDPVPGRDLRTLRLAASESALVEAPLRRLTLGEETVTGSPGAVVDAVAERLCRVDPDVLVVSRATVVPRLVETAAHAGADEEFALGRRSGYTKRAGRSTYESYGRVGHSPARYAVPGRAVVDESNTFFWDQGGLAGSLDLVERSHKPLQELSWASIGTVLTAIQIRTARERDVLVPWNAWRPELFKSMGRLHDADRGGLTLAPQPGVHEDVHELDFASLYPNIIVTRNVSPETTRCGCHRGDDVPGLGYAICDRRGYLADVLEPLIDDRARLKRERTTTDDPARTDALDDRIAALKWILVACFGYQGFSNAKFGRIECHEAINAYARAILLDAKDALEAGGWRVLHGIVDSLWVTPRARDDQRPLKTIAAEVTDDVGIPLEYEDAYDWLAFVPMRDSEAGALTRYFGGVADGDHVFRGIECRQRSTCEWVARLQRDLVRLVGETRDPEAVCDRLRVRLAELERGEVDPGALAVTNRVSRARAAYKQYTRSVAALDRVADRGLERHPGEDVRYVVVDDARDDRDRVRLASENPDTVDTAFYRDRAVRAAESVCAPFGWRRDRIGEYLAEGERTRLDAF